MQLEGPVTRLTIVEISHADWSYISYCNRPENPRSFCRFNKLKTLGLPWFPEKNHSKRRDLVLSFGIQYKLFCTKNLYSKRIKRPLFPVKITRFLKWKKKNNLFFPISKNVSNKSLIAECINILSLFFYHSNRPIVLPFVFANSYTSSKLRFSLSTLACHQHIWLWYLSRRLSSSISEIKK